MVETLTDGDMIQ